jgi:glycerophosphoryl diester phosphodiesterase
MRPLVISHRTQLGTMPENTLAGIDAALATGADGVEIDVRATSDGVPVLLHDATLERTTGDAREVAAVTVEALRSLRVRDPRGTADPQPVPALADALERIGGRCLLVIEIKQAGIEPAVGELIHRFAAAEWCWIWSFDAAIAMAARVAAPEVPASLLVSDAAQLAGEASAFETAVRAGFAGLSLERSLVDERTVERARRRGLAVYTWTVNTAAEVARVAAAGVDALCSDDAAAALAALRGPR